MARAALYIRVSTDDQTTENQRRELARWADYARHDIVHVFEDQGISGAKGRDKRPGLDAMLKAATRREFDVLAVWSIDRLGRSVKSLIDSLETLRETGRDLFIHQQSIDTATPGGRALLQMTAVFAEFERAQIVERVKAGMARAKANGSKFGRPKQSEKTTAAIKAALGEGKSVRQAADIAKASIGAVAKVRKAMVAGGVL